MLDFLRRNRLLATAALFLVVAATLIVRTSASRLRDDRLGGLFLELMAPLQRAATLPSPTVAHVRPGAADLWHARPALRALRAAGAHADAAPPGPPGPRLENDRLAPRLHFRQALRGELPPARVIVRDAPGLSRPLVIDQGTASGVVKGAAVLAPGGLVGQVFL